MPDPSAHDVGGQADPSTGGHAGRGGRRRLDNRTVAISICIALVAALVAALVVSVVRGGGGSSATGTGTDSTGTLSLHAVDPKAPTSLPDGVVQGLSGSSFHLTDFAGKPLVLNFFSTTCAPCIREMPDLERLHQQLGEAVTFVGIDVTDTRADGEGLVRRTGVSYRTGYDPNGDVLRDLGGQALPTTVIVDPSGALVETHTGALTAAELQTLLAEHQLGGTTAPPTSAPTTAAPDGGATTTAPASPTTGP